MADAAPLLDVDGIETCYGLSQVLFGMSLSVRNGEMVALMGRNGMGKTTTIRSIMGLTPARAGAIRFAGREVRRLASFRIAQLGIGLVPERRQILCRDVGWAKRKLDGVIHNGARTVAERGVHTFVQ